MTEIVQGATQTLQLTIPSDIDLSEAHIYFSIEQYEKTVFEKTGTDVSYIGNTIYVSLWQVDTLKLSEGDAKVMLNITMNDGATRIPTYEASVKVLHNHIKRVLT